MSLIGTKRSLPYLESTQKWAESHSKDREGWESVPAKMETYQRNLKRRLEEDGHVRVSKASVEKSKTDYQNPSPDAVGGYFLTSIRWLLASLGFLGLVVAGGAYFRKRKAS